MTFTRIALAAALFLAACSGEDEAPAECNGGSVQRRTRWERATVAVGEECRSEVQTSACRDDGWSEWSGTFTAEACAVAMAFDCADPAGAHASTEERTRYQSATVPYGSTCVEQAQSRRCWNGAWEDWTGTYTAESCAVTPPAACADPVAAHGGVDRRTRFAAATVPFGETCDGEEQVRTCSDGSWSAWSGDFTEDTCAVTPPRDCAGGAHGASEQRVRYASASVDFGQTCTAETQTRTCSDGAWSVWTGSYAATACAPAHITGITLYPAQPVLEANRTLPLAMTAIASLDNGRFQDITALGRWTSGDTRIATVGARSGIAQGVTAGTTELTIAADGRTATASALVRAWTFADIAPHHLADVDFAGDGDRGLAAAWSAYETGDRYSCQLRSWRDGVWSSIETLGGAASTRHVRAAMSARGDLAVLWSTAAADNTSILQARTRAAGSTTWSEPVTLAVTSAWRTLVTMTPLGRAIASWSDPSADTGAATFAPDAGWALPAAALSGSSDRATAIDADGNGIVLTYRRWAVIPAGHALYAHDIRPGQAPARTTIYRKEVAWNERDTLADFRVVMNGRGDAVALWVHGSDAGTELVAAHRAGGTWQAPVVISPMGTSQVLVNTAVMNDAGAVAVAFSSNLRDREHRTYAVTYTPGRSWSAPVGLSRPGRNAGFSDDDRAVAIDRDGRVLAAWTEPEGDDYVVSIRHFDPAAGWSDSRILAEGGSQPPVSVFPLRDGFVVGYVAGGGWVDGEAQPATIRAAFFR
jgi:hypothetical protein